MAEQEPIPLVHCPVCDAADQHCGLALHPLNRCARCGWPQRTQADRVPDEHDQAREVWAREVWQALQLHRRYETQQEYVTQGIHWLIERTQEIAEINLDDRLDRLEARLEAGLEAQLADQPAARVDSESVIADELPLYSELGIDYTPLALALSQADWRTADALTDELMRTAIARNCSSSSEPTPEFFAPHSRSNTILEDIAGFPATDLQTIAWAWAAYSDGRLGLAAQVSQWTGDYATFCDRVGWRNPRGWNYYDELRFEPETLESLPIGHFPVLGWRKRACYGIGGETAAQVMAAWFDRWQQITDLGEIVGGA